MRKVVLVSLLLFATVVTLQARDPMVLRRERDFPRYAVGFMPTDLFVPLFYGGFFSLKGEFMISDQGALTIPVGYAYINDDSLIYLGIGAKWLPMRQGIKGFYLGCDLMLMMNIDKFPGVPLFKIVDLNVGYKLCLGPVFIEPEVGYGLISSVDYLTGGFIAGLRVGVVF
jgi:hypothetical protein